MAETRTVALVEGIDPAAQDIFIDGGFHVEEFSGSVSDDELAEFLRATEAEMLGVKSVPRHVSADVISSAPNLKVIGRYGVGVDTIDMDAATEHRVRVFNGGGATAPAVGQYVIASAFGLAERSAVTQSEMGRGEWNKSTRRRQEIIPGETTMGLLGRGLIGQAVMRRALANGMNVMYFDPGLRGETPPVERVVVLDEEEVTVSAVRVPTMAGVLPHSDILSVHVPGIAANHHLIGAEQIADMPTGSLLINASRGRVVDTQAVADALELGVLGGAAIDVFENEPTKNGPGFADPLVRLAAEGANVLLTPHIGGSTEQGQKRVAEVVSQLMVGCVVDGRTEGALNAVWR